jgi:hypothetical protein
MRRRGDPLANPAILVAYAVFDSLTRTDLEVQRRSGDLPMRDHQTDRCRSGKSPISFSE